MKKVLLIGSNFSAAPMFFALKKRGYHVSVCGNRHNEACHQYTDISFYIDYSDHQQLLTLVEQQQFDYIVPTGNDCAYLAATWVAQQTGHPGFDSFEIAQQLHTKYSYRQILSHLALPSPTAVKFMANAVMVDNLQQSLTLQYPLLVKPTNSFSGRGVSRIGAEEMLPAAIQNAINESGSNDILIEEFIEGTLHSHSAFLCNQQIITDFFVDEYCTVHPYQVNCSNHPSQLSDNVRSGMRTAISRLAAQLHLNDGLIHTQFIVCGDRFWMIECMRRCPGDLYSTLIESSTDSSYIDYYIQPFIAETYGSMPSVSSPLRFISRHTISTKQPFADYHFSYHLPEAQLVQIASIKGTGEKVDAVPFGRLAILFIHFPDFSAMCSITPQLADRISLTSLEEVYLGS